MSKGLAVIKETNFEVAEKLYHTDEKAMALMKDLDKILRVYRFDLNVQSAASVTLSIYAIYHLGYQRGKNESFLSRMIVKEDES